MTKKYEGRKIVLILGAGCTRSEGTREKKPPLDKNFFTESRRTNKEEVEPIREYFLDNYNFDICDNERGYDSLEDVMVRLFADSNDTSMKQIAYKNFLNLIKLFNRRLAHTTNEIKPHPRSNLFRIIVSFLNDGAKPKDLSIITFNQDIQIEKTLNSIEKIGKYQKFGPLLNFPYCYRVSHNREMSATKPKGSTDTFAEGKSKDKGIQILKLHGSLNWYSVHKSPNVGANTLFKRDKKLRYTSRKTIHSEMKYMGGKRRQYTFPIIVPPVPHKSAIFNIGIPPLWAEASKRLKNATDVVVFGYSCPEMDYESSNLIQKTLGSKKLETFSIIDISPEVIPRFWELTRKERIFYYSSADAYINSNQE